MGYKDENECQRHLLLWKHLELSNAYLDPDSGGDGKTSTVVDDIIVVEPGWDIKNTINTMSMVEDIWQAKGQDGVKP